MASIRLERISRHYRSQRTLHNVTLAVEDRELLVLIGPSGAGKTTALRLIAGLDRPSEGRIYIGGRDVTETHPRNRNVAMVFQDSALYPHLTAYDNIGFPVRMRGGSRSEIDRRIREAAAMASVEFCLNRYPATLSGGQRQRVAIARAIAYRPSVLLLDEPFTGLDAELRRALGDQIRILHESLQTTIVYVTHDQEEAMRLGNRIAVLHAGELQQCAPAQEVYERPASRTVARLLGSPPINLIGAEFQANSDSGGRVTCELGAFAAASSTGGLLNLSGVSQLDIGWRPEDVSLADSSPPGRGVRLLGTVGTVERIESLGGVSNIRLKTPMGTSVVARTTLPLTIRRGEEKYFEVDADRLHFFRADGRRLDLSVRSLA